MIATPSQRNRLMQKLRAETCFRRKNGTWDWAGGRIECKGEHWPGDSVPRPRDLSHWCQSQWM